MSDQLEQEFGDIVDEGGNPESDLRAEHELIGAMLWHPEWVDVVRDLVSPREFFDRALARIFEGIVSLQGMEVSSEQALEWLGSADIAGKTGKQAVGYLRLFGSECTADRASILADRIFDVGERRLTAQGIVSLAQPFQSRMGAVLYADRGSYTTEEADFLVEDLIPERELVIIMGEKQTGKSFVTSHLGFSITRGVPFFDRRILEARPVIWCCYEGGGGAVGRMNAYSNYFDVQAEIPFVALTEPFDLWEKVGNVEDLIREIEGICKTQFGGKKPGAVIIDTHNAATSGASEIDSEVVSKIRDRYRAIMRALGCTVIIVGHSNAIGKHRGNGLLENNVPTVLTVSYKTRLENRQVVQVKDGDGRPVRTLHVKYQREGIAGGGFDFVLHGVETGIKNKFGKIRTSCVVVQPNWSQQEEAEENVSGKKSDTKAGFKLTDIEDHFFKVLWKQLEESGVAAPGGMGIPYSTRVVHRADVSKAYKESSIPEDGGLAVSPNTIKTRWTRATGRLRKFGVIGFKEPFFWWTGKPIFGKPETLPQRSLFDGAPDHEFPPDDEFPPE